MVRQVGYLGVMVPTTDASRQGLNEALVSVWGTDMVSHFLSDENGGDPFDPVITPQCCLMDADVHDRGD
ncbi:hypothetical protein CNMCM6805_001906 [Aspergillus fumigatiaffinis]|uniref:Uncharacterized protein n=1 Tax=Aspergillus fumigatiaffinis TaxID=340414 RepID=A0A8H4GUE6_9EURO|nr:hypothetical protein CNMCM6805_001906 [Aspergillus fumigatiaffinis]